MRTQTHRHMRVDTHMHTSMHTSYVGIYADTLTHLNTPHSPGKNTHTDFKGKLEPDRLPNTKNPHYLFSLLFLSTHLFLSNFNS